MAQPQRIFHLIPNAHLDPVWLWDWREGLNEGVITCRTVLDLMDEFPELTFMRGECAIYEHIQRADPAMFRRIVRQVEARRWDVAGGTFVQADNNIPSTETLSRQFLRGQRYFKQTFGKAVRAAWSPDSFGHSAGLPEILAQAGIEYFAFTRCGKALDGVASPAFWWEGPAGSRVLSYRPLTGWYGTERNEIAARFDAIIASLANCPLRHTPAFIGLGNHGGGPSRRQIEDVRRWAEAHPEIEVRFSTLHAFFDALKSEVKSGGKKALPVFCGELNFTLRGCYSSMAKIKYLFRRAEAAAVRSQSASAAISTAIPSLKPAKIEAAWDAILFNSFHDILPGSSIERACDDQIAWLGGAVHQCQEAEFEALNALAARIDTSVDAPPPDHPSDVAALVWNPHPRPFNGYVEIEASLDYRPIWQYSGSPEKSAALPLRLLGADGAPLPFQVIDTEHGAMTNLAWRKRVVAPMSIPAMGWHLARLGWHEDAPAPAAPSEAPAASPNAETIENGMYQVSARPGDAGIRIIKDGRNMMSGDGLGEDGLAKDGLGKDGLGKDGLLSAVVYDDPWGSWGGMTDEPESLHLVQARETWAVRKVRVLERGPHRAQLWVELAGERSWLQLSFFLCAGQPVIEVRARLLWNERSARLKLVMPVGDQAEFDVPGASVRRGPAGEVPGGRWLRIEYPRGNHSGNPSGGFGFASDALSGFDCKDGVLRVTVCRASRYANDVKTAPDERPWQAAADCGELKWRMLMGGAALDWPELAARLEQPLVVLPVAPHLGKLPSSGSLMELSGDGLQMLAFKPAEDGHGFILRLHERTGHSLRASLRIGGQRLSLGLIAAHAIAIFRLVFSDGHWTAKRTNIPEFG
ncbi:MAG: glycoside hydrolase family 38 [Candidatus Sumerlaeota bacterium]|nr:glycoside hydrolase family 38 [Candidatus Sumerlaeota bacterium]